MKMSNFFMICPICDSPNIEMKYIKEPLVFKMKKIADEPSFDRQFEKQAKKIAWVCFDCGCEF